MGWVHRVRWSTDLRRSVGNKPWAVLCGTYQCVKEAPRRKEDAVTTTAVRRPAMVNGRPRVVDGVDLVVDSDLDSWGSLSLLLSQC